MLVFALPLAMAAALATATAVTLHNDAQQARVKATVRNGRTMR